MPGPRTLPLEALAELASALEHASAAAVARAHGLVRREGSLRNALTAMRRAGGWLCRLSLIPCTECGLPVAGPPSRTSHVGCRPAKRRRLERERRVSLPDQRGTWRRVHRQRQRAVERAAEARRRAGLSAAELVTVRAKAVARNRGYQERTLEAAVSRGAPWSADDDAYLLEHWGDRLVDLGLALGRTWRGVARRRQVLGRQERAPCP